MTVTAKNPIMPGFYPDPSICAVGEDFYLVNSTFAYFPGLPIMHSRDLAHWEQAGNALNRESQIPLKNCGHSAGLFAPTIRFHEGIFYVICTNVSGGGNFIVTAQEPAGPWSEPYYLEGAEGIDPSLFFDEDGTCYYIGTHPNPAGCRYDGDWYIWIQELDLKQMKLVGEKKDVWNGAMRDVIWPEGPHLYKKDGYYYIMNAEGGTGPDHAVTICRSKNIFGPYQNNPRNPILTHRHLGDAYPIRYVGHADLVKTNAGEWYMVMLAVRPTDGYTTMGRETFFAKVTWENDWPVVNPGEGKLTETVEIQLPEWDLLEDKESYYQRFQGKNALPGSFRDYDFTRMKVLGDEFLALRNPEEHMVRFSGDGLLLQFGKHTLKEEDSPSYVAIRQQHHSFQAEVTLRTDNLRDGRRAGIALVQSNAYHLRVEIGDAGVEVILCERGTDRLIARHPRSIVPELASLSIVVDGLYASVLMKGAIVPETDQKMHFMNESDADGAICLLGGADIRCLSTEVAGGFVGCTVGMYAMCEESVSDTENETDACLFRNFHYSMVTQKIQRDIKRRQ